MSGLWTESLGGGTRYTESRQRPAAHPHPFLRQVWSANLKPARLCRLERESDGETLSYLTCFSFRLRFGEVSVETEGVGGFATPPPHRRRGLGSRLLRRALERVAERVPVVLLNGIQGFYPRYGFSTCLPDVSISLRVTAGLRAGGDQVALRSRGLETSDHEALCSLYNREHGRRPGTVVRGPRTFGGLFPDGDWQPGDCGRLWEHDGEPVGYGVFLEEGFGQQSRLLVKELVTSEPDVAAAMIRELSERAAAKHLASIEVAEPGDSVVGRALRRMGARVESTTAGTGGWMGRILDRFALVEELIPELSRRSGSPLSDATADALARGAIYPDGGILLSLLTGHYSWRDAEDLGQALPAGREEWFRRAFGLSGTPDLPSPCIHRLDHF